MEVYLKKLSAFLRMTFVYGLRVAHGDGPAWVQGEETLRLRTRHTKPV